MSQGKEAVCKKSWSESLCCLWYVCSHDEFTILVQAEIEHSSTVYTSAVLCDSKFRIE